VTRSLLTAILCISAGPLASFADEAPDAAVAAVRILVTIADPAMGKAARAGPARPGYARRSSAYLVSVDVKRAANRIAEDFGLVTLDEWPIKSLRLHCLLFSTSEVTRVEDLLRQLRQRPEVDSAQLLNEFQVSAKDIESNVDPYVELQTYLDAIELEQAHHWSLGDGARVSIIDTGADIEHPELRTRIESHRDFVGGTDSEFVTDAHGTAVAGVIGAESNNGIGIVGVAPSAHLSVLKACWHRQNHNARAVCNSFTLAKALDHAIESSTDIINLSLGGPSDALLSRIVEQALNRRIVVVAAAPKQAYSGFPSEIAGVIVVTPNEGVDSLHRPSIKAPGVDILVPVPRGGYDYASGSSLSAAHVSGIVALLVARRHELTTDQITSLLVNSQATSDGWVNACRALAELLGETGCRSSATASTIN